MQKFFLEFLGPCEVLGYLQEDEVQQEKPSKKKYHLPIPEHLMFYHIPEDINAFIEGVYPNMRAYLLSVGLPYSEIDEYISDFVVVQLSEDPKTQEARYKAYDSIKFPDIPYVKWFLTLLKFRKGNVNQAKRLHNSRYVPLVPGKFKKDEVSFGEGVSEGVLDLIAHHEVFYDEALDVKFFMEQIGLLKETARKELCFEGKGFELLNLKLAGYSNTEAASVFGISDAGLAGWMKKLKILTNTFFKPSLV